MSFKPLIDKRGLSYFGFQKWLITEWGLRIKELPISEYNNFIDKYEEKLANKCTLAEKYGINYDTFRSWLRKTHGVSSKDLSTEVLDECVEDFKVRFKATQYLKDKGITPDNFRVWLKNNYEIGIKVVDYSNIGDLLKEYNEKRRV